jgi:hypothetical protein
MDTQAYVIPYRIAGNRATYALTDHGEHWLPLRTSWNGDGPVHELIGDPWPWEARDVWLDAVLDAAQLALVHFTDEGDRAAVRHLPRAQVIARGGTGTGSATSATPGEYRVGAGWAWST